MQTHKLDRRVQVLLAIGVFLVALGVFIYSQRAFGVVSKEAPISEGTFRHFNFFASSTAQALTGNFATSTATTTGNTTFRVQVSPNGTDWYQFNKLVSAAAVSKIDTSLFR